MNGQLALFEPVVVPYGQAEVLGAQAMLDALAPLARHGDPGTSHRAADRAAALARRHREVILCCLEDHGPLGKDGIAARTQLTGVAVARRMCEMERAGQVQPTGKTVVSTAGRHEREWEFVS